jgi:hypothetical protein
MIFRTIFLHLLIEDLYTTLITGRRDAVVEGSRDMAIRDLSVGQMIQVSNSWLDNKKNKAILAKLAKVAPWLPGMAKAAENLKAQNAARMGHQTAVGKVMAAQEAEDATHDRLVRGGVGLLGALEYFAPELKQAPGSFLALQKELFPAGLQMGQRSYADEAAEHKLAPARLSAGSKSLLQLKLGQHTLESIFGHWLDSAKRLDTLEQQRNALVGEGELHKAAGNVRDARNAWIKAASAIETNLMALDADELDETTRNVVLATLRRYEELAARGESGVVEEDEDEVPGKVVAPAPAAPVVAPTAPTAANPATNAGSAPGADT